MKTQPPTNPPERSRCEKCNHSEAAHTFEGKCLYGDGCTCQKDTPADSREDTPPSGEESQYQTVKDSLTVTPPPKQSEEGEEIDENTSDGFHTFKELYDHRIALFLALIRSHPSLSWRANNHDDGTNIPGWFVAGIHLPTGDISYHIPNDKWTDLDGSGIATSNCAPKFDGHTSSDVVERLNIFRPSSTPPKAEGVGECSCGLRDPDSCPTHNGPQEWMNWLEKWAFNRANSRDGVKNLVTLADAKKALTSAVREAVLASTQAAEERKDGGRKKVIDAWDEWIDKADNGAYVKAIMWNLLEAIEFNRLPPPPDLSAGATAEEDKPTE